MLFLQHIALAMLLLAAASAQSFEAASVKMSQDQRARGKMAGGPGTGDPGQITYTNALLTSVLLRAYNLKTYQLGAPDWMSSRRYDILAKVPPDTTPEQFRHMLQNLLIERFHMAVHQETQPLQGFELVIARGGTKLKTAAAAPPETDGLVLMEAVRGRAVVSQLKAQAQPLSQLVERLSQEFRMPILDHTGLTALYDFTLEFAPQAPGAAPPAEVTSEVNNDAAPNLMTAVSDQLGLKLNPAKMPAEVLIVDRADPVPVEN